MSVSVGKVVSQTNAKIIAGGQDIINTARLVGVADSFANIYSVANLAALPPAANNTGRFIYVEDIAVYRYSDGTQWTNDYDTTANITNGQLWAWGSTASGRLGNGLTGIVICSPVREFCSATDWRQVDAGCAHTIAINTSNQLWSWGNNGSGELGDGTTVSKCSPVREFCSATDWRQVSAGTNHTAAIKTSGQLWVWGGNALGKLGIGLGFGQTCSPVREFCSATDWCQASTGNDHTAATKTSGQIWTWGDNSCTQLGDGTTTNRCSPVREFCSATDWCGVSAGAWHTAAIKTSGQIWSWGCSCCGVLGDGTTVAKCSPVREISSSTDWCGVSTRCVHTVAIKTSGQIWSWGDNTDLFDRCSGQLGDGTTITRCSPVREFCSATDWCAVSAGNRHSAAVKTSGQLWAWGYNDSGARLGDGTTICRCSPVREFCSATDWCQVSAANIHTAAVKVTKGFNEP